MKTLKGISSHNEYNNTFTNIHTVDIKLIYTKDLKCPYSNLFMDGHFNLHSHVKLGWIL